MLHVRIRCILISLNTIVICKLLLINMYLYIILTGYLHGPIVWNKFPNQIKMTKSLYSFKKLLKHELKGPK